MVFFSVPSVHFPFVVMCAFSLLLIKWQFIFCRSHLRLCEARATRVTLLWMTSPSQSPDVQVNQTYRSNQVVMYPSEPGTWMVSSQTELYSVCTFRSFILNQSYLSVGCSPVFIFSHALCPSLLFVCAWHTSPLDETIN